MPLGVRLEVRTGPAVPSAGLGGASPRARSSVGPCFGLGQHLDTGRPGLPAGGAGGAGPVAGNQPVRAQPASLTP